MGDALQPDHLTAADRAVDIAFPVAAAALEFDLLEADVEPVRADLADAAVIIEINVAEAGAPRRAAYRGAAGLDG